VDDCVVEVEFNIHDDIDDYKHGGWDLVNGPSAKVEQGGMACVNSDLSTPGNEQQQSGEECVYVVVSLKRKETDSCGGERKRFCICISS
jgi:hypothetical protein